jgi:cell wall-associated NlpC family hydrolase
MWFNKYIGIPFKDKGRDKDGADCYGLVRLIYKNELNIDLPDLIEAYESANDREALEGVIDAESKTRWKETTKPKEFDVIVLKMCGAPSHLGVVIKNNYMIHCHKGSDTAIEQFNGMKWEKRILGFYTWGN